MGSHYKNVRHQNMETTMDSEIQSLRIYKCEQSSEYAKRVMASQDISYSLQCLIRLRKMNTDNSSDSLVCKALWESAIVRTFSIFDGQYSIKLDILDSLPEGARDAYAFFRNYRSKHVTHKANPIDQVKAGIFLSDPSEGVKEVLGVGNLVMGDASYSDSEFIDSLGKFLEALRKQLGKELEDWSSRLLEASKKENIEDLYKLPALRVVVPSSKHLKKNA